MEKTFIKNQEEKKEVQHKEKDLIKYIQYYNNLYGIQSLMMDIGNSLNDFCKKIGYKSIHELMDKYKYNKVDDDILLEQIEMEESHDSIMTSAIFYNLKNRFKKLEEFGLDLEKNYNRF